MFGDNWRGKQNRPKSSHHDHYHWLIRWWKWGARVAVMSDADAVYVCVSVWVCVWRGWWEVLPPSHFHCSFWLRLHIAGYLLNTHIMCTICDWDTIGLFFCRGKEKSQQERGRERARGRKERGRGRGRWEGRKAESRKRIYKFNATGCGKRTHTHITRREKVQNRTEFEHSYGWNDGWSKVKVRKKRKQRVHKENSDTWVYLDFDAESIELNGLRKSQEGFSQTKWRAERKGHLVLSSLSLTLSLSLSLSLSLLLSVWVFFSPSMWYRLGQSEIRVIPTVVVVSVVVYMPCMNQATSDYYYWLLTLGCWMLAFGFWMLVTAACEPLCWEREEIDLREAGDRRKFEP